LNPSDFEILIGLVDRMIEVSEPMQGEYYRGYREGLRLHRLGGRTIENFRRHKSYRKSGDPYLDSYIRGFTDGCRGVMPESLSDRLHASPAS
jgi:hypothetical protein